MVISSNDFRTGTTIEIDGVAYKVLEFLHVKPGKGAAFVRTKLKNMSTGNNIGKTFKAGEMVQTASMEKVAMQHTYMDDDLYVFMNMETFDEERLTAEQLGETAVKYMMEGLEVEVLKHSDKIIGVEMPKNMTFTVVQCDPGVRGNTAQGGVTKPATIETGASVAVPLFIKEGERIVVNTADGKYVGRSSA
ncbi:elongation factor P [Gracilaria domingensis]|nr:elongation factor P [Gracilaria domingensis]